MTSPTPSIPGVQQLVADLQRRVRDLETGAAARPTASAILVTPAHYAGGDASRWPMSASSAWVELLVWWARMEWTTLDLAIRTTTSGARTGQWRLTIDGASAFDAPVQAGLTADALVEREIDLTDRAAADPRGLHRFTIDARVGTNADAGGCYVLPERVLLSGVRGG